MRLFPQQDPYSHIARTYDSVVGPFLRPIRREICKVVLSQGYRSFLDICCGTGEQCEMLARLGLSATGIDLSPAMLATARAKGSGLVCYHEEDASKLHFSEESFDAILISLALHEKAPDVRDAIVREALRVLKKGGMLMIVDYTAPDSTCGKLSLAFLSIAEWFAGSEHYAHFRSFMKSGALDALLRKHNLSPMRRSAFHWGATALVLAGKQS
ncbi:MAG: methyltransferase domain-containing protein [Syntrophobacteraceae bacterium]